jgi:hypothetical protein
MPLTRNWNTNSAWSDYQTAKFYSLIDGNHKLCGMTIYSAARIIGCPKSELEIKLRRLQSQSYVYALQRWRNPYQLYEVTRNVALVELEMLLVTVDTAFANYVPGADNTLEQQIKYKYVRINHETVYLHRTLMTQLQTSSLLEIMYNSARLFVARYRSLNELVYFDKMFESRLPRDCFVNVYSASQESGISRHRDLVSFCTVVFCLLENEEGKLVLTKEDNVEEVIHLHTNDMITFARISHSVELVRREQDRITVNAFF